MWLRAALPRVLCAREGDETFQTWDEKVESEGGGGLKLRAKFYMEGLGVS
jgi:hypothetical protein